LGVLVLLMKQDSGLLLDIFQQFVVGNKWCLAISFDCSMLNGDCGHVDCGTNILCGCWHFWQNKIQVHCWTSSNIIAEKKQGGRCDILSFHLIAHH
jgi:hypothetical protein